MCLSLISGVQCYTNLNCDNRILKRINIFSAVISTKVSRYLNCFLFWDFGVMYVSTNGKQKYFSFHDKTVIALLLKFLNIKAKTMSLLILQRFDKIRRP